MKRLLGLTLLLATLSGGAFAQQQRDAESDGRMEHRGRDGGMYKDLNLTDAQKGQMKTIRENYRPKMEAIRNNTPLSDDQRKSQMMDLMKQQHEEMNAVLTPDQRTKLEADRKDRTENGQWGDRDAKGKWKDKDGKEKSKDKDGDGKWKDKDGSAGWKRGDRDGMMKDLNLTDAQKAQMKTLHEGQKSTMDAIRNNSGLTDDQKKEQIRAARADNMQKMRAVLTPEQQAKWDAKMQEMKNDKNK